MSQLAYYVHYLSSPNDPIKDPFVGRDQIIGNTVSAHSHILPVRYLSHDLSLINIMSKIIGLLELRHTARYKALPRCYFQTIHTIR